ncbi:MAG: putative membrane protein [Candidatus Peregrinibacteria bacterium GW2011_GWF2_33_10]|nr:MAG: putative membrane protein [Candidatus Peregrinibacteria bacterium GW2011_GWF2_33_10]OGJ44012.1 MAG: hypothetical protein A2263_01355 [Candidatus Peregrinibacteria bacterium RIFOXYA2_FULL_33_21]OGJ47175.1 MAG: hypothetical protein A2272_05855 [Candidatus Peregrinibacteria bacterium RIFOXYA12_FULL_33_12]OGJ49909.1 MAG: hypothetical protein A2307_00865 [Candidatus Peregrinibacteria bacterium RIFOXYB2_FULL_33_20]
MNIKRIILISILLWIVNAILGQLTCGWLFNWVYQIPPMIWKTAEEIIQTKNMIGINIIGLMHVSLFTLVYAILYKGLPGKKIKKAFIYAILVWLVGALPGIASMPFYMTISTTVIIYWLIQALIFGIIDGLILGALYKGK